MDTKVDFCEGMGRVLVAERCFEKGELVIEESPLLIWDNPDGGIADYACYLRAFTAATTVVQQRVQKMFHPPLGKAVEAVVQNRAPAYALAEHLQMEGALAHKLILVRNTNAHTYYGQCDGGQGRGGEPACARAALFELASKAAHCCHPNTMFSTKTESGKLHFVAIQPIQVGDQITTSYIDDLWSTPTAERRHRLWEEKDFFCSCARCVAPDPNGALSCPRNCGGFALPGQVRQEDGRSWHCPSCGEIDDAAIQDGMRLEVQLTREMERLSQKEATPRLPAEVERFVTDTAKSLSPIHFLRIRGLDYLAKVYSDLADAVKAGRCRNAGLSYDELRRRAAAAGLHSVSARECLVAGCFSDNGCDSSQPVVYECHWEAFNAGQELMAMDAGIRPKDLASALARYFPEMRLVWGKRDQHVIAMDVMCRKVAARVDPVRSTARVQPSSPARAQPSGDACDACGKVVSKLMACSRCKTVRYCSRECQSSSWRAHKASCIAVS